MGFVLGILPIVRKPEVRLFFFENPAPTHQFRHSNKRYGSGF